jgi:predicted exporter
MSRAGRVATLLWALLALAAAGVVAHATYSTDLSAFLPRRASATQRLLVEQLREGPAAHVIIVAIEGGDAATRAQVSELLATHLKSEPSFFAVNNGDAAQLERDRQFLFEHRYLLSPTVTAQRFSVQGLHEAIGDSLDLLASPEGMLLKELFTRDPTGELLSIIDTLDPSHAPHTSDGVWSSPDGAQALLIAQTRAAGSDTDGQQAACDALRRDFNSALATLPPAKRELRLLMSGPPVWAVTSRATIETQVARLSLVSALLITALLLSVYRSLPVLALTLVPVASGALAGVAAVALGFATVHGITLGFGVTLIGEAVDYSIYLFVQRAPDFRRSVWPTIRLGVLTSICGFAALLPSSIQGLAQLGLYSIAGLIAAALVTRFVLPEWLPRSAAIRDLSGMGAALARWLERVRPLRSVLWLVALGAATVLYLHRGVLWNHELSALSPIPLADQALDERLRAAAGAPDSRYVIVAEGAGREGALAAAEAIGTRLTPLVDSGALGSFESPARFLPPLTTQTVRQASLPPPGELATRLAAALEGLPVSPQRLQPFIHDVDQARTGRALTREDLAGTSLDRAVDALLVRSGSGWMALLPLAAKGSGDLPTSTVAQVRTVIQGGTAHAQLLDLKGEADRLYSGYLIEAVQLGLLGLAAIVLLLLVSLRSPTRVVRVVTPLALSVLTVAGALAAAGQRLTILHIVGMLLIVAVGSNYALFFDRVTAQRQHGTVPLTLASLAVANLATVIAFGVLASSSVPVLADLGMTVAPGTLLALLFAALLAGPLGATARVAESVADRP